MISPTRHSPKPTDASQSADVTPASADTLLTLSDRAYEAQCALSAIKSYAYGGIVTSSEARECARKLAAAVASIESVFNGQDQEPLLG